MRTGGMLCERVIVLKFRASLDYTKPDICAKAKKRQFRVRL